MEWLSHHLHLSVEAVGIFAPILFISFHLLRPLLFLPIIFICIFGGVMFGAFAGSLYSIIGITLSCMIFYGFIHKIPLMLNTVNRYKNKLIGPHAQLTTTQITLLRLIPFIHFHALSLLLIEASSDFREYTKASLFSSIPLAIIYTTVGQWLSQLSPLGIIGSLSLIILMIYLLRNKHQAIKWNEFFQMN